MKEQLKELWNEYISYLEDNDLIGFTRNYKTFEWFMVWITIGKVTKNK